MMAELDARTAGEAEVVSSAPGRWRLRMPAGPGGSYRLAQLDDYSRLPRSHFLWRPPVRMEVRARVSEAELPGTWGLGLWNDPFTASLGLAGTARRLPALPQAAWFFYASPPNYLALHDTHPAQGLLAATFASQRIPAPVLAVLVPVLPLLAWPLTARWLRRVARRFVAEDALRLDLDPTEWHSYRLEWRADGVSFVVDGEPCFSTPVAPRGPLGLVLWIDNQYAAFPPDGRLRFGTLPNPPAWLELADLAK
ncbi:MAG: hypothetical protein ACP5J4_13235 [Anaerolineae bacterium]